MADDGGTMAVFDAGDGVFARFDAIEKVAHVIVADFEMDRVVGQRRGEQFLFAGGDFVAVDPDPAVGADEFDAVALAVSLRIRPNGLSSRVVLTVCVTPSAQVSVAENSLGVV